MTNASRPAALATAISLFSSPAIARISTPLGGGTPCVDPPEKQIRHELPSISTANCPRQTVAPCTRPTSSVANTQVPELTARWKTTVLHSPASPPMREDSTKNTCWSSPTMPLTTPSDGRVAPAVPPGGPPAAPPPPPT